MFNLDLVGTDENLGKRVTAARVMHLQALEEVIQDAKPSGGDWYLIEGDAHPWLTASGGPTAAHVRRLLAACGCETRASQLEGRLVWLVRRSPYADEA